MPALESPLSLEWDDLRPVAQLMHDLTGRRPSTATVWRWCSRGTSRAGVLPSVTVFGTRHTTREALIAWLRRGSGPNAEDHDERERQEVAHAE